MSTQGTTASAPPEPEPTLETPSEADELPLDHVFEVLSNERRRHVLRYMLGESESTTLSDLAEHIASIENDKPVKELTSTERKRVYICLYQAHLPKMSSMDVIDFDEDRKTVDVGENFEQVTEYPLEEQVPPAANSPRDWITAVADLGRRLWNGKPL